MPALPERLAALRNLLQSPEFLQGKGLGNEGNMHIFCYPPEDEMQVRRFVRDLASEQDLSCRLHICNLYHLFLSICDELDITEAIPEVEETEGPAYLLEQLSSAIDNHLLVEHMHPETFGPGDVLLLTGVGEAFPFVRIHTLLPTMQPECPDVPVLVLYPGDYDRYHTRLFGRLSPRDYYRAFRVL